MSLLSALTHRGETAYVRPPEEPLGDLVVDSVVIAKDIYRRDIADLIRGAFRKELQKIEWERDQWKAKASENADVVVQVKELRKELELLQSRADRVLGEFAPPMLRLLKREFHEPS